MMINLDPETGVQDARAMKTVVRLSEQRERMHRREPARSCWRSSEPSVAVAHRDCETIVGPTHWKDLVSSKQVNHVLCLGLSALASFGLMLGAPPIANDTSGADASRAAGETPRSSSRAQPLTIGAESLDEWADSVRRQHNIPAIGVIVFRADTVLARGIAGVRRSDSPAPVEAGDRFQLGSNTKAITATVLATFVEEGKLAWTTTLAEVFPELRDSMSAEFRAVTIDLLLSHHAGISPFEDTDAKDFKSIPRLSGTPIQRRAAFTAWVLRAAGPIGEKALLERRLHDRRAIVERIAGELESLVRAFSAPWSQRIVYSPTPRRESAVGTP
jgi:hypothetical protein